MIKLIKIKNMIPYKHNKKYQKKINNLKITKI